MVLQCVYLASIIQVLNYLKADDSHNVFDLYNRVGKISLLGFGGYIQQLKT